MLEFRGIQKTTLVDYPGEVASTLFLGGCNFRCFYCFNPTLVFDQGVGLRILPQEALDFLKERKSFLTGLCITGGEPLSYGSDLLSFLEEVKQLDYKVKVDTNGSFPKVLSQLIAAGLVDYLAMDIKAPLDRYEEVVRKAIDLDRIRQSVELIKDSGVDYEFRTTVFAGLNPDDFKKIGNWLAGSQKYCLQQIKLDRPLLDETLSQRSQVPSLDYLRDIAQSLNDYFAEVVIRN